MIKNIVKIGQNLVPEGCMFTGRFPVSHPILFFQCLIQKFNLMTITFLVNFKRKYTVHVISKQDETENTHIVLFGPILKLYK